MDSLYLYSTVPITDESGNPNFDLNASVQMSWLAIGLYVYLRKNPSVVLEQIVKDGYGISEGVIVLALHELIDQGLVTQQVNEGREVTT